MSFPIINETFEEIKEGLLGGRVIIIDASVDEKVYFEYGKYIYSHTAEPNGYKYTDDRLEDLMCFVLFADKMWNS